MQQNRAVLLHSQDGDWEGLFINGKLISEGHQLGEGRKETFWLDIGAKYQISGADLAVKEVDDIDGEQLSDSGNFPLSLDVMHGSY